MNKLNKILKDNKYTVFGILVFIGIAITAGIAYKLLFGNAGTPVYGNRLEGIEEVEITKKQQDEIISLLKKEDIVVDASSNIKGRILNVTIIVKEKTKLNNAKKLTSIITDELEDDQKKFYDIQVFLDNEKEEVDGYPTIGYQAKSKKSFKYSSASYEDLDKE